MKDENVGVKRDFILEIVSMYFALNEREREGLRVSLGREREPLLQCCEGFTWRETREASGRKGEFFPDWSGKIPIKLMFCLYNNINIYVFYSLQNRENIFNSFWALIFLKIHLKFMYFKVDISFFFFVNSIKNCMY